MNYTKQANDVLKTAKAIAKELHHPYVGTEHLLLGLRRCYIGVAGQILAANGVEEENIYKIVEELISPVGDVAVEGSPKRSPVLFICTGLHNMLLYRITYGKADI